MIQGENYTISQYSQKDKVEWDIFIDKSKNGTFLHKIDYLHYHLDKFIDCSLIIRKRNLIVALMPGNIEDDVFFSHKGLTYGGLLILPGTKIEDVILYFTLINQYLKEEKGINKVVYKPIPYIYSDIPSQEDEYALFRLNASLISSGIASVINLNEKIPYNSCRKRKIKKAQKYNLEIKTDYSYEDFWDILTSNLQRTHNASPVHKLSEIKTLKKLFPDNIKLFSIYLEDVCLAGAVIYITKNVAHVQYISANENGKKISALDFLFDYLINQAFENMKYFDFGTSVEKKGYYLNEGLSFQKQGFGARGVLYQQYEYETKNVIQNDKNYNSL
ncbi:GNAT family N-acetyltransferase [Domibacillus sp. A3M-37]|uniref:GNAT family N-acetyltransferase n=1 Tax=Domibacillus sp. A3M-37 TaxID=2962037 RepID=UPI0020B88798|nr:GNAT family N-acetyltransferase [Domibacillus sp. A3M-37]MCP3761373.1 GNAT family N-acetyltransferase [Domibacillus sp. A3M-37]